MDSFSKCIKCSVKINGFPLETHANPFQINGFPFETHTNPFQINGFPFKTNGYSFWNLKGFLDFKSKCKDFKRNYEDFKRNCND